MHTLDSSAHSESTDSGQQCSTKKVIGILESIRSDRAVWWAQAAFAGSGFKVYHAQPCLTTLFLLPQTTLVGIIHQVSHLLILSAPQSTNEELHGGRS
ncbi:hypothetical protein L2E82_25234 [Cichorium intybus]|uniref:Uncharacterized protein n=1 Tax=Cichorium intybus TaxID=13427 RepID=A0ACB9E2H6_CICIN|nr:hypothetical protein L2E82_25234 [Cichorium intybus]